MKRLLSVLTLLLLSCGDSTVLAPTSPYADKDVGDVWDLTYVQNGIVLSLTGYTKKTENGVFRFDWQPTVPGHWTIDTLEVTSD